MTVLFRQTGGGTTTGARQGDRAGQPGRNPTLWLGEIRDHLITEIRRSDPPRWSSEGAWLRGMESGLVKERLTSRQRKESDIGPVHRVWYK